MTDTTDAPAPYRVVYSEAVREVLRDFAAAAREAGKSQEAVAAVKEFDRRLRVYPQFGEPMLDLTNERGQICLGTVPPLGARYAIYEERRLVIVTVLRILDK